MPKKTKWHHFGPPEPLKVGDKVRLWAEMWGTETGRKGTGGCEYGIVVQIWPSDDLQDCCVAFVGDKANFNLKCKDDKCNPYILRYHNTSLEKLK